MGVESTFSMSLFYEGQLWGLIACHHDQPDVLPFDIWMSLREVSTALTNRIGFENKRQISHKVLDLRKIEADLACQLRSKGNLMQVMDEFSPALMKFMHADGFAFQYGDQVHLSGNTPPADFIPRLIEWAQDESGLSGQFQTCSLHKEWPTAEPYKDSACGVLLQPVALHRTCQMIWFRRPLSETVRWAGEPVDKFKALASGEEPSLQPRHSFATWVGEHNDFSQRWTDAELDVAREILREILDILTSVLILSEENTRLKTFAANAAAHDIKAPLRQMEFALHMMGKKGFDPDSVRKGYEVAVDASRILKNVSSGLLEFMSVPDSDTQFTSVDLNSVFEDVATVMGSQVASGEASLSFDGHFEVRGERNLLTSLFINLVNNAVSYSKPDQMAEVCVQSIQVGEQWVQISVTDNGIGIPVEYVERIFMPSQRLKDKPEVEGVGLGLSICRRIVEMHKGTIYVDPEYADGARFVVRLLAAE